MARISIGRSTLHPTLGLLDLQCGRGTARHHVRSGPVPHTKGLRAGQNTSVDPPAIQFGTGPHVGAAIYGTLGTLKRRDFTATGPAMGLAYRCAAMTRSLDTPLIATGTFTKQCPSAVIDLGQHVLRGFAEPIAPVSYPQT